MGKGLTRNELETMMENMNALQRSMVDMLRQVVNANLADCQTMEYAERITNANAGIRQALNRAGRTLARIDEDLVEARR